VRSDAAGVTIRDPALQIVPFDFRRRGVQPMIHHFSFAAERPQRAAEVIAALWRGRARPFPPVAAGSWMAMAGDERGTSVEVYPAGAELRPVDGDADSQAVMNPEPAPYVATHAAIASPLTPEEVFELAAEQGWIAKYRKRGGVFGVIEFWVESRFLLEVLTPEMQREYTDMMTAGPPSGAGQPHS
jgi:hypothetical protein